jgi:formate dehydrogenase major subunit
MTNGWIDIKNTDMMLIMGGNPAENHPCGFKWAVEAKRQRNAKMIVVDPRFTRTAAVADQFLQIRAGTDIAFLGGVIHYALENQRVAKQYLVNFTNAAFIVKEGFKLPEDGLYSGFDGAAQTYDKSTWNYEESGAAKGGAPHLHRRSGARRNLRHLPHVSQISGSHQGRPRRAGSGRDRDRTTEYLGRTTRLFEAGNKSAGDVKRVD